MEYKELSTKTVSELTSLLAEKRGALRQFRFASTGSRTTNVKDGRNTRRQIARILTALRGVKVTQK